MRNDVLRRVLRFPRRVDSPNLYFAVESDRCFCKFQPVCSASSSLFPPTRSTSSLSPVYYPRTCKSSFFSPAVAVGPFVSAYCLFCSAAVAISPACVGACVGACIRYIREHYCVLHIGGLGKSGSSQIPPWDSCETGVNRFLGCRLFLLYLVVAGCRQSVYHSEIG